ncbi:MAG: putative diguanylate cyclase YedQ [Pelotomaculum sp. PtaU1.Bin065]|nr:MAG: putative diguanylate cyclase YedQ [Pelotomaculum sp. PtaU1.Bin065]
MRPRSIVHILYVWLVVGLAAWQLYLLFPALDLDRVRELLSIVLLGVLSEWLAVSFPHGQLSGGFALVLSAYLIFGPAATAWVSGLSTLFGQGIANRGNPVRTTVFNAGQYVLAAVAAGHIYQFSGGRLGLSGFAEILPLAAFTVCYMGINHLLIYFYLLPKRRYYPGPAWLDAAKWDSLTYLFTVPLGLLIAMIYIYTGLTGIMLLFSSVLALQLIMRHYIHLHVANRELKAFYDVATILEKNPEPAELLAFILRRAGKVFPYHSGVAYLRSGERDSFAPVAATGPYSKHLSQTKVYSGEGIAGCSIADRKPEIISDCRTDSRTRNEAGLCQIMRSLLIIPLLSGEEELGVIVLGDRRPMVFDEKHLHIMAVLGGQAALTVGKSVLAGRLEHAASLDVLTGLLNSGVLFHAASEICGTAGGSGVAAGLMIIGVDRFKAFNDRYGRAAGDWTLAELAGIIKGATRGDDLAARYGGDEFAVILPGASGRRLMDIAGGIRDEIEEHYFLREAGKQARITVSIGAAEFPQDAGDAAGLFKAAQRALDKAKKDGGNRVVSAAVSIIGLPRK